MGACCGSMSEEVKQALEITKQGVLPGGIELPKVRVVEPEKVYEILGIAGFFNPNLPNPGMFNGAIDPTAFAELVQIFNEGIAKSVGGVKTFTPGDIPKRSDQVRQVQNLCVEAM